MAATHVFIDTNIALHYQRPDQIDWRALTGGGEIILVAAPILVRELEREKVQSPLRKLRERAAQWVRWLLEYTRDPSKKLRDGVRWHFIGHEPAVDFPAQRLSRDIADDHLIASVLDYAPADGGAVCVATGDGGLEIKLRQRNIDLLLLPERLLLPPEPDVLEKKVKELERQLAQQRAPKLALAWESGAAHCKISLPAQLTHCRPQ